VHRALVEAAGSASVTLDAAAGSPVNILLVDDRQENLLALRAILSDKGYNLVLADSGAEALNAVLTCDFAVILLDVAMPGMDGFETATLIKQRPRCRNTPIIFITASIYDLDHVFRGYSVGAVDYLQKPVAPDVVRAKVGVFVALHRQGEHIKAQAEQLQESERRERELLQLRAEAALSASEAQYEATVREAPFGMAIADDQGRWLRANSRMCSMLGYKRDALPGLPSLLHPAHAPRDLAGMRSLLAGQIQNYRAETRLGHKNGWVIWANVTFSRLVHGPDAITRFAVVVEDITDRKWRELCQQFLNQASEILLSSLDYSTTLPAVARLAVPLLADWCAVDVLRTPAEGMLELAFTHARLTAAEVEPVRLVRGALGDLHCGELRPGSGWVLADEMSIARQLMRAGVAHGPHLVSQAGLKSALSVPISARGKVLGRLTLGSEAFGRSYTSADMMMAEDLAHRCAFAIENSLLYQETQNAVRARDEFLSVASHELRTPLTPLRIQLQRLIGTRTRPPMANVSPERLREILQRSEKHVQRLGALIDNLLDVSRITAGKLTLEFEAVDLAELTREVVSRFHDDGNAEGPTILFEAEGDATGRWDKLRIEQVITNLLTNAIKYGAGKPVSVRVESDGHTARLSVQDQGIGIDQAKRGRIFDRFERAVDARAYGGLGLGLFIARQILDAHGGVIRVASQVGEGSTFTVELPVENRERRTSSYPLSEEPPHDAAQH
jgi:PAS domain S-box-containing protein